MAQRKYEQPIHEQILKRAGLDEKETKIYLAALKLRQAGATEIAEEAGIHRTTSYFILEELVVKGLISKTDKSGVLLFVADSPELLRPYLENQKANLSLLSGEIEKIIPNLKKLQKEVGSKPSVEYYEGKNGLIAAFESVVPDLKRMAKSGEPFLIHTNTAKLMEIWPEFPAYAKKRLDLGVKIKLIVWRKNDPAVMEELYRKYQSSYQIRRIDPKYAYSGITNILDQKVLFFDFDNLMVAVIKSKSLVEMMRIFFEFMWENSR